MSIHTETGATRRGSVVTVHDDRETVRRSITIRRPIDEVRAAWKDAGIPGDPDFAVAPGDMGTEVRVTAPRRDQSAFREIAGALADDDPGESLSTLLRRFRGLLETGEIATTHGQPSGRDHKST